MKEKLVQINTVFNVSTGRIMADIQKAANEAGYETISFAGRPPITNGMKSEMYGNPVSFWSHVILTTLFDAQGYGSYFATKKLIRRLREEKPDIIHLHNLHGYYLHLPLLCRYLNEEYQGKIFWTFHDCWPITGHCAHFVSAKCNKWQSECYRCKKKTEYPISLFWDGSKRNYKLKKKLFTNMKNLTIIVPSQWMQENVKKSFLKEKRIEVVHNGIDLNIFQFIQDNYIWDKYNVPKEKKIILGVASIWGKGKGLEDFIKLSKILPEDYHIVLVGLNARQIRHMPDNITGILRTDNREELVRMYSNACVFMNPSVEESFSLVTVEALACGTPVIALDTSAVKELVSAENGIILSQHTPQDYLNAILVLEKSELNRKQIRATAEKYDASESMLKVMNLYWGVEAD